MNGLNSRTVAIISYITWIGWVFALIVRNPRDTFVTHPLNQALMINIIRCAASLIIFFPIFGRLASWIIGVGALALWLLGIYRAYKWSTEPLPIIGKARLID